MTGKERKCRHCTATFVVCREWQLFCGDACRRRWNYEEAGFCFYCGELGNTQRDHIHPVAARGGAPRRFGRQETVHACRECNSTLGSNIFKQIENRIGYLEQKYIKKYKLNQGAIVWNEGDLNELGRGLRLRVRHLLSGRQKAERRVAYLQAVMAELLRRG